MPTGSTLCVSRRYPKPTARMWRRRIYCFQRRLQPLNLSNAISLRLSTETHPKEASRLLTCYRHWLLRSGGNKVSVFLNVTALQLTLYRKVWLLRDVAEDGSAYTELLDKFLSLPASRHTKASVPSLASVSCQLTQQVQQAEENILMGNLSMNEVYARFRSDIALSSLPESSTHGIHIIIPDSSLMIHTKLSRYLPGCMVVTSPHHPVQLETCSPRSLLLRNSSGTSSRNATVAAAFPSSEMHPPRFR